MSTPADTWSENGRRGGGGEAEAGQFAREARTGQGVAPAARRAAKTAPRRLASDARARPGRR